MDDADLTDRHIDMTLEANLHHSYRAEVKTRATGQCLYCEKPLDTNRRWCDAECRDNWELGVKL